MDSRRFPQSVEQFCSSVQCFCFAALLSTTFSVFCCVVFLEWAERPLILLTANKCPVKRSSDSDRVQAGDWLSTFSMCWKHWLFHGISPCLSSSLRSVGLALGAESREEFFVFFERISSKWQQTNKAKILMTKMQNEFFSLQSWVGVFCQSYGICSSPVFS